MVSSLRNSSDESIIRLTYLAEKLTPIEYYRDQIRGLRQMFEEKTSNIFGTASTSRNSSQRETKTY